MNNFTDLLKKYTNKVHPDTKIKSIVKEVVCKYSGISLDLNKITIYRKNIKINATPIIKSEIFFHKEDILQEINTLGFSIQSIY